MDYTSAVTLALQRAAGRARQLGADAVEPVHVLLGLLDEEEGRPAVLLAKRGVDLAAARSGVAPGLPARAQLPDGPADVPFSAAAKEVLAHAVELGRSLSAEYAVASEQVLLAVLRENDDLRAKLESLGLDFLHLERDVLGEPGPPLHMDEPLSLHDHTDHINAARILDAAANRAREGLRVLEDFCRFVLDDAFLSRELKETRHGLAAALKLLPASLLLEARDTLSDVGTTITMPAESERAGLISVVEANAKRLQEALRSLEEYGKLQRPELGRAIETLRYRVYTLERALLLAYQVRERLGDACLYVLVDEQSCKVSLAGTISEAAAGGAQVIQLREKGLDDRTLLQRAREVRAATRKAGVLFIMNDRPDIARLADADGVHLGQDDLAVHEARRILGADAIVGVSTHTIEQVRQAVREGASYIGVGPTFPSSTKHFEAFPGLDFVGAAMAETSLPAFVLGGITLANLAQAVAAGARRVAVAHAICAADEPRKTAARMRQILITAGGAGINDTSDTSRAPAGKKLE